MEEKKEKPSESKEKDQQDNPVEQGQKVIDVQKKLSKKPPADAEKENKEDAEKWRNEG